MIEYVLFKEKISLLPDWFYVFKSNSNQVVELWGKNKDKIIENLKKLGTEYFIYIYDKNNLNEDIKDYPVFEVISEWNLNEDIDYLKGISWENGIPKYQLVRYKGS